jgi:hypothetical protein
MSCSFIGKSQTVGVLYARELAKASLVKAYGRDKIKEIEIEIIEWDYNSSNDRYYMRIKS